MGYRNEILPGDVLDRLRELPDGCVQTCVTSPPYYRLRDYGVAGQIGLEPTPAEYVARLVAVFAEVRRVLRDDGTLWLNMGDSYAGGGCGARDPERWPKQSRNDHMSKHAKSHTGLKPKDLVGAPWALAFALRADGWYLRSDIIFSKPNPMPESVLDRPTRAHEYLFLLSKSARYYYNAAAIREPLATKTYTTFGIAHAAQGNDALGRVKSDNWGRTVARREPKVWRTPAGWDTSVGDGGHGTIHRMGRSARLDKQRGHSRRHSGFNDRWDAMPKEEQVALGANKRSVWTVAPAPFPDAHFATMPPKLIEPCILAGSRPGDLVLDPFMGSGTTALVALQWQRDYLGIELNPAYIEMAKKRLTLVQPHLIVAG